MEVETINTIFPNELLHMVFTCLPPRDRISAILVCQKWRNVISNPKFWAWVYLTVTNFNVAAIPWVLGFERLKAMNKLCVGSYFIYSWEEHGDEFLLAMERHPGLKELDAEHVNLSFLEPNLLARVVKKLEKVYFSYAEMTAQQCEAIFQHFDSDSKLKKLHMSCIDLSSVNPEILARSFNNIEEVFMFDTKLTILQTKAIFRAVNNGSKMKNINIGLNDLSMVDPKSLAKCISTLWGVFQHLGCLNPQKGSLINHWIIENL